MSALDPPTRSPQHRLTVLGAIAGVSFIAANIGTILSAKLVKTHPALLLALSSRNRHLLLTKGTGIGLLAFALIPLVRTVPVAVSYFLMAHGYGEQGKAWMEREAGGMPGTVAWAERLFDRLGPASLLLFAGSQLAWLIAGLRKIPTRTFLAFEVAGMAARVGFFWLLGERFKPQLTDLLSVIGRFTMPLTVVLVGTVGYQTWRSMQRMEAKRLADEALDLGSQE